MAFWLRTNGVSANNNNNNNNNNSNSDNNKNSNNNNDNNNNTLVVGCGQMGSTLMEPAKAMIFDRLGKKVRPGTSGKIEAG